MLALWVALLFLAACSSSNGGTDAGPVDARSLTRDAAAPDVTPAADAEVADAPDAADAADAADVADADPLDSGPSDTGIDPDACVPVTSGAITSTGVPTLLSQTGLYADLIQKTITPGVEPFAPAHVLWSDGADKQRWVWLPECAQIDATDMDHWSLPTGTKLFKEFSIGGARLETRMIVRTGSGAADFAFAQYAWNDTETEATLVPLGQDNVRNTTHDIPSLGDCRSCHTHLPERALGFSAIQLSHNGPGVTVASLSQSGRLSMPYAGYTIPGDPTTAAALGYLHANCGNCHNESPLTFQFLTPFSLRLSVTDLIPEDTGTYRTAVDQPVTYYVSPGITHRVARRSRSASCVYERMDTRGNLDQMPPIATDELDRHGLDAIGLWIDDL